MLEDNRVITFRQAEKSDYIAIKDLMNVVFGMDLKKENYEAYLADKNNRILVAEVGKELAASICIEKQWNAFTDKSVFFLRNGAVAEAYRKNGIFTEINKIIYELARQGGVSAIELTCADHREDSQRYYLNHGYTIKKTKVFIREIEAEDL